MSNGKKVLVIGEQRPQKSFKSASQNDIAKAIIANWGEFDEEEIVVLQPLANTLDFFKSATGEKGRQGQIVVNAAAGISFINSAKRALQFEKQQGRKITPELLKDILVVKKNGIEYTIVEAQEKHLDSIRKDEEDKMSIVADLITKVCEANGLQFEGKLTSK